VWHNDFGAYVFDDPDSGVTDLWYRYHNGAWEWSPYQKGPFQSVNDRTVQKGWVSTLQWMGLTDVSECNKALMDKLGAAGHVKPYAPPNDEAGVKALLDRLATAKGEKDAAYCVMVRNPTDYQNGQTCCKSNMASTDIACCQTTSGLSEDETAEKGPTPRGMYRMENRRTHPTYNIPWFNLQRYQKGKFLAYDTKGTDGRYVFGFHPGRVSHGCVTIVSEKVDGAYDVGEGSCWNTLQTRVEQGAIDDKHPGYMFVW
jgi:hypothetical protein